MLVVHARYWNDMDWLEASLQHIELWQADAVWISEGCWDPAFPAQSADGTREAIEAWAAERNHEVIDNVRTGSYRDNQAATSQRVMELAACVPGDWMVTVDCDHFYSEADIRRVKSWLRNMPRVDCWQAGVRAFLKDARSCELLGVRRANFLPYRVLAGCHWVPTCHLARNGVQYEDDPSVRQHCLTDVWAYHYEGLRPPERLRQKYGVGDRRTPEAVGRKATEPFTGEHPSYVIPTLRRLGYL